MNNKETHHLLPSGSWSGFYCYKKNSTRHRMDCELIFQDSTITGCGTDDVAPYTWKGTYNLETFKAKLTKSYATHQVFYEGDIDENGIWGFWELNETIPKGFGAEASKKIWDTFCTGGFHIWPKKGGSEETHAVAEVVVEESKKVYMPKSTIFSMP